MIPVNNLSIRKGTFFWDESGPKSMVRLSIEGRRLDIGCGSNKMQSFIGMDCRELPGVDLVHNAEEFPYPFSNDSLSVVLCSHLIEHIKPWLTIDFLNEVWRILEVGGQLLLSTPYGGSFGYWQDPTHINGFNEATFMYFDPDFKLYNFYRPNPWKIHFIDWNTQENIDVILEKRELKEYPNGMFVYPRNEHEKE
jgi:SAM-dependent methyltransferase